MSIAVLLPLAVAVACSDDPTSVRGGGSEFAGISWVAPDRTGKLVVAWTPARGAAGYRIYASRFEGRALKNAPIATITTGTIATQSASTFVVAPTTNGERHYLTVRALDAAGHEDGNTIEKSAVASPDTTPPEFAGPTTTSQFANAGATVSWNPAVDDASPPEAIAYDVYAGKTADTLVPIGRTSRGETSLSVAALGPPGEPWTFSVRARDVGDNVSVTESVLRGPLGADTVAPAFGGCVAASDVGGRSVTLSWAPAVDDHSAPSDLTYEIYVARASGAQDFMAAPRASTKARTSMRLHDLEPGVRYFFVCRARDVGGNHDENAVETSVTTATDVIPPTFGGLATATVDGTARTVDITWEAAVDDTTPSAGIVYDVFETKTPRVYDYLAPPRATSAPGATSLRVTSLEPRSTLSWVVRARDAAFNRDTNTEERSGTIKTSFSVNVVPIFVKNCAVVGCHVSGAPPVGLNLAPAFAYDFTVGVTAGEQPAKMRIAPRDTSQSYLFEKITEIKPFRGSQMPAPQTGNALSALSKDIITSWILEGAPRN